MRQIPGSNLFAAGQRQIVNLGVSRRLTPPPTFTQFDRKNHLALPAIKRNITARGKQ